MCTAHGRRTHQPTLRRPASAFVARFATRRFGAVGGAVVASGGSLHAGLADSAPRRPGPAAPGATQYPAGGAASGAPQPAGRSRSSDTASDRGFDAHLPGDGCGFPRHARPRAIACRPAGATTRRATFPPAPPACPASIGLRSRRRWCGHVRRVHGQQRPTGHPGARDQQPDARRTGSPEFSGRGLGRSDARCRSTGRCVDADQCRAGRTPPAVDQPATARGPRPSAAFGTGDHRYATQGRARNLQQVHHVDPADRGPR